MSETNDEWTGDGTELPALLREAMLQPAGGVREVDPQNLRAVVGAVLDLQRPRPQSVNAGATGPTRVALDTTAWLAWMDAGLRLFAVPCAEENLATRETTVFEGSDRDAAAQRSSKDASSCRNSAPW